jgi:type IV pilus assembly protein PilO
MSVFQELQRFDSNNPGKLSPAAKGVLAGLLFAILCIIGYFWQISPKITERDDLAQAEAGLKQNFAKKQARAARLEDYKQQVADMENMLKQLIRKLPSKTQMADLLVDISQEALASGINTELFEPKEEIKKDFYAEKPISLRMVGSYHQFGHFVSGVANLPRVVILTMHDIALKPNDAAKEFVPGQLVLEGTVKTYRYLDPDEQAPPANTNATTTPGAVPVVGGAK